MYFLSSTSYAQEAVDEYDKPIFSTNSLLKKIVADNKFKNGKYQEAILYYESLRGVDPGNSLPDFRIALSYFKLKEYRQAILNFSKVIENKKSKRYDAYYYLGRCYHLLYDFELAIKNYNEYKHKASQMKIVSKDIQNLIAQCLYAKEKLANPTGALVYNAGQKINSNYADYAPYLSADNRLLIYTSRRDNTTGYNKDPVDGLFYEDIYISSFDSLTGEWTIGRNISEKINTISHEANLAVSPDGKTLLIYKNVRGGDLYESKLDAEGNWSPMVALPFGINSNSFESSASLTRDEKTLFFTSNRSGGFGQGDVYVAKKETDGSWGKAKNLGALINTKADETSCFITQDGKTLFFSSKGHIGMGGYDFFVSTFEKGAWTKPVNLAYPLNSTGDDLHFSVNQDGSESWFSSVREENGNEREIYFADLRAMVPNQNLDTNTSPPENLKEELSLKNTDSEEAIEAEDKKNSRKNKDKKTIVSGQVLEPSGKGIPAEITLHAGSKTPNIITDEQGEFSMAPEKTDLSFASIEARKTGYQAFGPQELTIKESETENATIMHFILRLKEVNKDSVESLNKVLDANPMIVLFEFASAELILENGSEKKLDDIAEKLKLEKKSKLELFGYTDLTGTPLYNKQLSLNRAEAVAMYLKEKGVPSKRIRTKGMGASNPIATNETERGRRTNRRVEIIIK